MIPRDWQRVQLQQIATVVRGKFAARPRNDPRYYGGSIPFVQTGDVSSSGGRLTQYTQTLNQDGLAVSCLFPKGTILVTIAANIGDVAMTSFDVACPDSLVAVKPHSGVSAEWLFYTLQTKKPQLNYAAAQNAQKNINLQVLRPLEIHLPPLPEQRKIAEILSTWDEALALVDRRIEAAELRKKGLMQRLLTGRVRFPEFVGEAWQEVRLRDIAERVTRKNTVGCEVVLTASAQHGLISQTDYFNKRIASDSLAHYYLLQRGEFAYNKSSSEGYPFGAIKRLDDYDEGALSTLYVCFRLKDESPDSSDFLAHFFEAGRLNRGIYAIAQEGARNHGLLNLSLEDFFNLEFIIPSPNEQRRIAEVLDTCDREISLLQRKRDLVAEQKKGLMQRLLTGRVRVTV